MRDGSHSAAMRKDISKLSFEKQITLFIDLNLCNENPCNVENHPAFPSQLISFCKQESGLYQPKKLISSVRPLMAVTQTIYS